MTNVELYQRCKDEFEMETEIICNCYAKGYNKSRRCEDERNVCTGYYGGGIQERVP